MISAQPSPAAPSELLPGFQLSLELELGLLLIGGLFWIGLLVGIGRLSGVIPMPRERRILIERVRPVMGVVLALLYLLFAARILLRHGVQVQVAALLVLGLALLVGAWFAVKDLIAGVVLKAGRLCSVGDQVTVAGFEGRVVQMGLRSVSLETNQGDEAVVPYSVLSQSPLLRSPSIEGVALHVFRLRTPVNVSVADARQAVLEGAMCAHWASVVRPPQVKPLGNHEYEISVFALDPDHGPDVEAAVLHATGFVRPTAATAKPADKPTK